MEKCRSYHGNKMKVGDSTVPKIETVSDDDGADNYEHMYFPDIPIDKTTMPEQDGTDDTVNPIDGLDHIVDSYINMEVRLPSGEKELYGQVMGLCLDKNGRMIGNPDNNPYMNTVLYEIKFEDGLSQVYGANIIAENMWRNVSNEGYHEDALHSIVDIRFCKNAVKVKFIYNKRGKRELRKTKRGVDLLCAIRSAENEDCLDRITNSWIPLKELKAAYPLQVAEFAVTRELDKMPAFAWWVPYTLKKRDTIIASVRQRIAKTTHKYGIIISTSWKNAQEIDTKNGTHLWRDALAKEMQNVGVAFNVLVNHQNVPVGWTKATGHLIWDVKMDFTRKVRWVKDDRRTADPLGTNHAGVVSRDSV